MDREIKYVVNLVSVLTFNVTEIIATKASTGVGTYRDHIKFSIISLVSIFPIQFYS